MTRRVWYVEHLETGLIDGYYDDKCGWEIEMLEHWEAIAGKCRIVYTRNAPYIPDSMMLNRAFDPIRPPDKEIDE